MQILKGLEVFRSSYEKGNLTIANWEKFIKLMETTLPIYNWQDDPTALLGINSRREMQLAAFRERPNSIEYLETQITTLLKNGCQEDQEQIVRARWLIARLKEKM
jgi:hypothetical protein